MIPMLNKILIVRNKQGSPTLCSLTQNDNFLTFLFIIYIMKKEHFRFLSSAFFLVGIFFLLNSKTDITGAVVGVSNISSGLSSIFGIVFIIVSLSLLMIQGSASIDDLVEEIHEIIEEQKQKYKSNPIFVTGLKEIEKSVDEDKDRYYRISSHGKNKSDLRKAILKRIERRKEGLERREEYFFQIPHHAKHDPKTHETTVIDLPDKGLYEYVPMGGRKSKFVELEVTHYTDDKGRRGIYKHFKNKDDVFLQDTNFGAYFISNPLPQGLKTKKAMQILGIGNQTFAGKKENRIPKYEISTKIKVRKERVLVKDSYYNQETGGEISLKDYRGLNDQEKQKCIPVKKYAIAGGVLRNDILGDVKVGRYYHKDIDKENDNDRYKKEKWEKSA